jgi:hypothetical protein
VRVNQPLLSGAIYGLLATFGMTVVMLIGMSTGIAPMPEPIPTALAERLLEGVFGRLAPSTFTGVGLFLHFGYGGLAGVIFVQLFRDNLNVKFGLLWGGMLWLIMQIAFLPLLGWGLFGISVTGIPPKIAVGTLVLHLIYGGILGRFVGRETN